MNLVVFVASLLSYSTHTCMTFELCFKHYLPVRHYIKLGVQTSSHSRFAGTYQKAALLAYSVHCLDSAFYPLS